MVNTHMSSPTRSAFHIITAVTDALFEPEERRLIWSVNMTGAYRDRGPNWAKVANQMHLDPRTVKRRYLDALYKLWYVKLPTAQNVLPMTRKKATN